MSRLRADIFVAAYIRRCEVEGASAMLRRRGSPEAGAIFVKLDCLDGRCAIYGPAPQSEVTERGIDRVFARLHKPDWIDPPDAEDRLRREISFDSDIWIVEVEDRKARHFLDIAE